MENTTFETMPKAIDELRNGQSRLEELVSKLLTQHPQQEKEEFITLKQVCGLTGYAAPTIYGLVGADAIPYFKRGQRLFFDRAAILAWIKEGKRKSKAEIEASADALLKKHNSKR
jgi:predicted DNA-binding transcriptional regulator AlpA